MKVDMKGKLGILLSFSTVTTFEGKMTELISHTTSNNNSSKVTIWKCGSVVFLGICPPFVPLMTGVIVEATVSQIGFGIWWIFSEVHLASTSCRVSKLQTKIIQFFLNKFCRIDRILSNIFVTMAFEPTITCVIKPVLYLSAMKVQVAETSFKLAQFMLQWSFRFSEFSEILFHLRKTPLFYHNNPASTFSKQF